MALTKNAKRVNRRIYFYRVSHGIDDSGCPIPFDAQSALSVIGGTEFSDTGRYLTDDSGDSICLWPIHTGRHPTVRFARIRRSALPQIEENGTFADLAISDESGLVESIHGVFFENDIAGFEYNNHAPRVSRLGYYLTNKAKLRDRSLSFDPIIRNDITDQLDRLQEMRFLEIKARRGISTVLRNGNISLSSAFDATEELVRGGDELAVSMKISPSNRREALRQFIQELKWMVSDLGVREHMTNGVVKGKCLDSNRVETVDLLRDKFIVDVKVVRLNERTRAVDEHSIIKQIEEAYEALKDQLERATSISS